ncbi:MAG TPA: bifunctional nuclease family protein [Acidimicrobiia bacterium]|nr:bifunctional nuclease family protein [Acidimicrobiia bacterium]
MSDHTTARQKPVRVEVRALVMDPVSHMPVVILQQPERNAYLPIWIGVCEANAIALRLEHVATPRPMTHDLIHNLLGATRHVVEQVLIHSLNDSVFLASIRLRDPSGAVTEVDARPSDAIAIALRADAPVLVQPAVLDQAEVQEASEEETLRLMLERLRPEDMGRYEM